MTWQMVPVGAEMWQPVLEHSSWCWILSLAEKEIVLISKTEKNG